MRDYVRQNVKYCDVIIKYNRNAIPKHKEALGQLYRHLFYSDNSFRLTLFFYGYIQSRHKC